VFDLGLERHDRLPREVPDTRGTLVLVQGKWIAGDSLADRREPLAEPLPRFGHALVVGHARGA
jgi:hypothetical protein